jgi:hypothetical protein
MAARGLGAAILWMLLLGCNLPSHARAQDAADFLRGNGMPYAAFDRLPHTQVKIGDSVLNVGFAPGDLDLPQATVLAWIQHSATVVAGYYGRFPVDSARILIVPVPGTGVRGGTTWAYRGAAIRLVIGSHASQDDLKRDWMVVHEMVHLALPELDEQHNWLSEGLATYIEPIARVQAGDLSAETIWAAMVRDMPKGLPQTGDQGLDHTPTWGRTYWGGAMFCLLADVDIRKRTANRLGLQDAMRGVLAAGGNHEADWTIQHVLAAADAAVGVDSMSKLYAQLGEKSDAPDLQALWTQLGIRQDGSGGVSFDKAGAMAGVRAAITEKRGGG